MLVMILLGTSAVRSGNVPAQTERKPFVLENVEAEAQLEAEYFRTETRSRQGAREVLERSILSQLLGFRFEGYSFDPRLLRYQLDLMLENEFLDEHIDPLVQSGISASESTRADRINYDLRIHLFPDRRESLSLWARRRDYRLDDLLYDVFSVKTDAYGAKLDSRNRFAPFTLLVETRDTTERGLFEETREDADTLLFEMTKPIGEHARLDVDYEYLDRRRVTRYESGVQPFSIVDEEKTHRGRAFFDYRFGPERRSNYSAWVSYLDRSGTVPYRNALARQRLILHHRPNLQTDYGFLYEETEIGGRTIDVAMAEAGLTHRLFDNFLTRLDARFRRTDEPLASFDELELQGNWNYWRHVPWGRLVLNYWIHSSSRDGTRAVDNSDTLNNRFEVIQEFKVPLRVFYRLDDYRYDPEVALPSVITDSTEHTVGYEIPWRRLRWLQQFSHLDDTLGQTDTFHSNLSGSLNLPWQSTLNLNLAYEDIDYHGRIENSQTWISQAGYVLPFGRTGLFELELLYTDRTGTADEQDWNIRSALEWQWRKLRFDFSGQYGLFENRRGGVEREATHLLFTITREF